MDSQTFWNLTLYDWSLWVERIRHENERKRIEQEYHWERQSYLMALVANAVGDKKSPKDYFVPSWSKNDTEVKEKDTRTPEEVWAKFPDKLPKIKQ